MADPRPADDLRAAFERLDTQEKTAFILQATFDTIGRALGETGARVASAVRDFDLDACFRAWEPRARDAAREPATPDAPAGPPADPLEPPAPPAA